MSGSRASFGNPVTCIVTMLMEDNVKYDDNRDNENQKHH